MFPLDDSPLERLALVGRLLEPIPEGMLTATVLRRLNAVAVRCGAAWTGISRAITDEYSIRCESTRERLISVCTILNSYFLG